MWVSQNKLQTEWEFSTFLWFYPSKTIANPFYGFALYGSWESAENSNSSVDFSAISHGETRIYTDLKELPNTKPVLH